MEKLLIKCVNALEEGKTFTEKRLDNFEVITGNLEHSLANLQSQSKQLEYNVGVMATKFGSKHKKGQFPSLPVINPKNSCHVVQLRSGTSYEPHNPSDVRQHRTSVQLQFGGSVSQAPPAYNIQRPAAQESGSLDHTTTAVPASLPTSAGTHPIGHILATAGILPMVRRGIQLQPQSLFYTDCLTKSWRLSSPSSWQP